MKIKLLAHLAVALLAIASFAQDKNATLGNVGVMVDQTFPVGAALSIPVSLSSGPFAGMNFFRMEFQPSPNSNITSCTVALDSDLPTWTFGGAIAAQSCSASGVSFAGPISANNVRVDISVSGSGFVRVRLLGSLATLATSGSGTLTGLAAGTGLSGGGLTGNVSLALLPPTTSVIGGVQSKDCSTTPGQFLQAINTDGTETCATPAGGVAGPGSSVVNHVAVFNNTGGSLLADGGALATVATSGSASDLGTGTLNAARLPATAGLTGNPLSQFAATTSAQLRGVISDETGSGGAVFATGPHISGLLLSDVTGTTQCLQADATGLITGSAGLCGGVAGPGSSTSGHLALFNNGTGSLLSDGGAPAAVATSGSATDLATGTLNTARLPAPFTSTANGVTGSVYVATNAASGSFKVPGLAGTTVATTSDTPACDTGIAIVDRATVKRYTNNSSVAITLSAPATSGCGSNYVLKLMVEGTAGAVVTPASGTIDYCNGWTCAVAQSSMPMAKGGVCTVHSPDNTNFWAQCDAAAPANAVANTQLAQMAANTFKANNTGSTANATDITVAQAKTLLAFTFADLTGVTQGLPVIGNSTGAGTASSNNGVDPTVYIATSSTDLGAQIKDTLAGSQVDNVGPSVRISTNTSTGIRVINTDPFTGASQKGGEIRQPGITLQSDVTLALPNKVQWHGQQRGDVGGASGGTGSAIQMTSTWRTSNPRVQSASTSDTICIVAGSNVVIAGTWNGSACVKGSVHPFTSNNQGYVLYGFPSGNAVPSGIISASQGAPIGIVHPTTGFVDDQTLNLIRNVVGPWVNPASSSGYLYVLVKAAFVLGMPTLSGAGCPATTNCIGNEQKIEDVLVECGDNSSGDANNTHAGIVNVYGQEHVWAQNVGVRSCGWSKLTIGTTGAQDSGPYSIISGGNATVNTVDIDIWQTGYFHGVEGQNTIVGGPSQGIDIRCSNTINQGGSWMVTPHLEGATDGILLGDTINWPWAPGGEGCSNVTIFGVSTATTITNGIHIANSTSHPSRNIHICNITGTASLALLDDMHTPIGASGAASKSFTPANMPGCYDISAPDFPDGILASGLQADSGTVDVTVQGGSDTSNATSQSLGSLLLRGADATSTGNGTSIAGELYIRGGNNAIGSTAASEAGSVIAFPGASTGATQGKQGLIALGPVYVKGATVTQWNLQSLSGAMTTADAGASPQYIIGVAELVGSNTAQVIMVGQTPINASAAVTNGHTVCAAATAGQITDSGGTNLCPSPQITVGQVLATSGTWHFKDGATFTATTTLPLIQLLNRSGLPSNMLTGTTPPTNHGVALGKGTQDIGSTSAGALDTFLQGQGASADPSWTSLANTGTQQASTYSTSTHSFGAIDVCGVVPYYLSPGITVAIAAPTTNATKLWAFTPICDVAAATTVNYAIVTTADNNSGAGHNYGIAILDASGTLLKSTGAVAGTTFSPATGGRSLTWTGGGSVALTAGTRYYFALTTDCAAACATLGGGSQGGPATGAAGAATTGGVPAGGTPPADAYTLGNFPGFILH